MKAVLYFTILSVLLASNLCIGNVFVYEGFDYSGADLDGQAGGTGFSGAWISSGFETSINNLIPPVGYGKTVTGGRVAANSFGVNSYRDLASTIETDPTSETVLYFSCLYNRQDSDPNTADEYVNLLRLKAVDNADVIRFAFGSNDQMFIDYEGVTADTGHGFYKTSTTCLVTGKMVFRTGLPDDIYMKLFEEDDIVRDEPAHDFYWDLHVQSDVSTTITKLWISIGSGSDTVNVDEMIFGTSWEDVVANTRAGQYKQLALPVTDSLIAHLDSEHVVVGDDEGTLRVIEMIDQSGNEAHAGVSSLFSMPEYVPNAINGYPALHFDGDDYLEIGPNSGFNTDRFLWVIVCKADFDTVTDTTNVIRTAYESGAGSGSQYLWGSYTAAGWWRSHSRDSTGSIKTPGAFAPVTNDQWVILQAGWWANDYVRQWMNYDYYKATQGATAVPVNHLRTRIAASSANAGPDTFFKGDIAEIVIYNKHFAIEEYELLTSYLEEKYGISTLAASPAPVDCEGVWMNQMGHAGDLNKDCTVDSDDLSILANEWLLGY